MRLCVINRTYLIARFLLVVMMGLISTVDAATYQVPDSGADFGIVSLPVTFTGTVYSNYSIEDGPLDVISFTPAVGGVYRLSNSLSKLFGDNHSIRTIVYNGAIEQIDSFYGDGSVNVWLNGGQYYTVKVQMISPSSFTTTQYAYSLNIGSVISSIKPDLSPHTPDGWASSMVLCKSSTDRSATITSFNSTENIYLSWAFLCSGKTITSEFLTRLYIDGVFVTEWTSDGLEDGYFTNVKGYNLGKLSAGTHTIKLETDATGIVAESNEGNNTISRTITVKADPSSSRADLSPHTPDGWASSMVLCKSSTDRSATITSFNSTENIYLSWAFLCSGKTITSEFLTRLYIDGVFVTEWTSDGLEDGYFTNVKGYNLGKLSAGTHTIKLETDATGIVAESNEGNNIISCTVTIKEQTSGQYVIRFIRNEGSGYISNKTFKYGTKTRIPSLNSLGWARRGYTFKGWATSTANARNGKIWKKDWAYVSTAATAGKTLTVYAVWKLTPGYYSIRFNKNDGSGKWRELGYKYGDNTTLPTIANGLQWSRAGYRFGGWATSAANAANGIVWRGDKGVTRTPIAAGKTLNVYAIWKKSGAAAMSVNTTFALSSSAQSLSSSFGANAPAKLLPGYYSGELADGTGTYDLLVDEGGETGYVNIVFDDGCVMTAEVDVDFLGDIILVTDESYVRYELVRP